ncbi:MAG: PTS glucose transporter subunit IIA, partial [Cellulomonadaceae bacterium]|nr:PTS glucose transporter subunit IIA [Cellulomonadaceae bacterium]
ELLIHIGLTTYELANFFSREVKDGETVAAGDLLLQFDLPALIKKGYDPTTAIWCPNATAISDIHMGPTHIGDPLFTAVIPAHQ